MPQDEFQESRDSVTGRSKKQFRNELPDVQTQAGPKHSVKDTSFDQTGKIFPSSSFVFVLSLMFSDRSGWDHEESL